MNKNIIIDRYTYRAIMTMNHEEMQSFLMHYAEGLLEENDCILDLREAEKDIQQIKCIGKNIYHQNQPRYL